MQNDATTEDKAIKPHHYMIAKAHLLDPERYGEPHPQGRAMIIMLTDNKLQNSPQVLVAARNIALKILDLPQESNEIMIHQNSFGGGKNMTGSISLTPEQYASVTEALAREATPKGRNEGR